ncbi:MAG: Wzz/FepE/Etk N-terminal domain-containing protein [Rubrivivax sp.]
MNEPSSNASLAPVSPESSLVDAFETLRSRWRVWSVVTLATALIAAGVSLVMPPVYTGRTTIMPPQSSSQSLASLALGSLGALSGIAAAGAGLQSVSDQFIGLLASRTIQDRLVDAFGLATVYEVDLAEDARRALAQRTQVIPGRRDGLLTIEVQDRSAERAAAIANRYVAELRRLSGDLAITEAQRRRRFFEAQLEQARQNLARAEAALQSTGFNEGALRGEPKAAAESYARLRAQIDLQTAQLSATRATMTENTPEVQQQIARIDGIRRQLALAERSDEGASSSRYSSAYRDFKYHETLFELFARQFELAKVDEAREGALIQVVDAAVAPERRSRPRRTLIVLSAAAAAFVLSVLWVLFDAARRRVPAAAGRQPASHPH